MEETISAPSGDRRVIDHAANEPEAPKRQHTSYDRELERVTQARAYFDDHDPDSPKPDRRNADRSWHRFCDGATREVRETPGPALVGGSDA